MTNRSSTSTHSIEHENSQDSAYGLQELPNENLAQAVPPVPDRNDSDTFEVFDNSQEQRDHELELMQREWADREQSSDSLVSSIHFLGNLENRTSTPTRPPSRTSSESLPIEPVAPTRIWRPNRMGDANQRQPTNEVNSLNLEVSY